MGFVDWAATFYVCKIILVFYRQHKWIPNIVDSSISNAFLLGRSHTHTQTHNLSQWFTLLTIQIIHGHWCSIQSVYSLFELFDISFRIQWTICTRNLLRADAMQQHTISYQLVHMNWWHEKKKKLGNNRNRQNTRLTTYPEKLWLGLLLLLGWSLVLHCRYLVANHLACYCLLVTVCV